MVKFSHSTQRWAFLMIELQLRIIMPSPLQWSYIGNTVCLDYSPQSCLADFVNTWLTTYCSCAPATAFPAMTLEPKTTSEQLHPICWADLFENLHKWFLHNVDGAMQRIHLEWHFHYDLWPYRYNISGHIFVWTTPLNQHAEQISLTLWCWLH